jgi:HEAT repeat protein
MDDQNEKEEIGFEVLLEELTSPDRNQRLAAAKALGKLRDPRAVEALTAAFEKVYLAPGAPGAASEWSEIALALGRIGTPQAVDALISFLSARDRFGGPNYGRSDAAHGLGEARDPRAVEALASVLDDVEGDIRRAAACALGRIGDAKAIELLLTCLQSEYPHRRLIGVLGLMEIKAEWVVEPLITALQDQDDTVRSEAAAALGASGDSRAIPPLINALSDEWWVYAGEDKYYTVRESAKRALKEIGEPATDALIALLKSDDVNQRWVAARFLGDMEDLRAVEPLTAVLNDPDSGVRLGAKNSLERLG